jgi:signal transduction histidine kinase
VDLQADVLAYNPSIGFVFLRDRTGFMRLDTGLRELELSKGRVRLQARCVIGAGQWPLIQGRVLEQNESSVRQESYGAVFLERGCHDLRLLYWQRDGQPDFRVYLQGPRETKKAIPRQALSHPAATNAAEAGPAPGLSLNIFNGVPRNLSQVHRQKLLAQGTLPSLDLRELDRTNAFTAELTGHLAIEQPGLYTFSTAGAGNCLLFLDEDRLRITGDAPPIQSGANQAELDLTLERCAELRDLMAMDYEGAIQTRLDGVVCHANPAAGLLVLRDPSGAVELHFPPGTPLWPADRRLLVRGTLRLRSGQVFANQQMLLDNDRDFGLSEPGRAATLTAGDQPFRLESAFQGSNLDLTLVIEGPGLPRQSISSNLLHLPATAQQGLRYRIEDGGWNWVPEPGTLPPSRTGWAPQFQLPSSDTNQAGIIRFSGSLSLPEAGGYHFRIRSPLPSRMFLLRPELEVTPMEGALFWPVRQLIPGVGFSPADYDQWSTVEGTVGFISQLGRGVRLEITSEQGSITAHLPKVRMEDLLPLNGSRVRLSGIVTRVYNAVGPWGGVLEIPDRALVEVKHLPDWLWNTPPPLTGPRQPASTVGSPTGLVRTHGTWAPLDDTGLGMLSNIDTRAVFRIPAAAGVCPGAQLDAVGRPAFVQSQLWLDPVAWRETSASPAADTNAALPVLTSLEQIHQLSAGEAARRYPVHARGILVSGVPIPVLQDATRGIYLANWTNLVSRSLVGDAYEIQGHTDPGGYAPIIRCTIVRHLGVGQLPPPRHPTWAQMRTGSEDAQWSELEAVIQGASNTVWQAALQDGLMRVRVADATPEWCASLKGALVRLQGVPLPVHNEQRQLLEVFFHVPGRHSVCIERPPMANPFELPASHPSDLLTFRPEGGLSQGVRLRGTVTYCGPDIVCFVDGEQTAKCHPEEPIQLMPGDLIDTVGFPELGVYAPVLRQAKIRLTGHGAAPRAPFCSLDVLLSGRFDGARVTVQGILSSWHAQGDRDILNLQIGSRLFAAKVPGITRGEREWEPGSLLEIVAVCNGLERDAAGNAQGRRLQTLELLVGSERDVKILARPPWWNTHNTRTVLAGAGVILLLSVAWIWMLRRQVAARTRGLLDEIEMRKQTEARLHSEVEERTRAQREVERVHHELMLASRLAGMAEVATGVLHNVGNVLNSINIAASCVRDKLKNSRLHGLYRLSELLQAHKDNLAEFFTREERGRKIPAFVDALSKSLAAEQQDVIQELDGLQLNVDHVREIVSMQQTYARVGGVAEQVEAASLFQDALVINEATFKHHGIRILRDFPVAATLSIDRHKTLQILVNLLNNARRACMDSGQKEPEVRLRLRRGDNGTLRFEVADNGVGIPPENLTRIFVHGFTTRKDGHGFGLHNSAIAAKELGGSLTVQSAGSGQGATFILEVPLEPPSREDAGKAPPARGK